MSVSQPVIRAVHRRDRTTLAIGFCRVGDGLLGGDDFGGVLFEIGHKQNFLAKDRRSDNLMSIVNEAQ
ncbi:hypothetical protein ACQR1Y_12440 [Bradyrhizobium sp. HKCCYLRH3099]|uniref:hypothetical protein n=1 Tax=Bradyrhizobium TaxID=374 RepID=UPI003EBD509F